jgi:predicted nuclease with TOPRIM domain
MSKLDSSMERFFKALDTLEASVNRQAVQGKSAEKIEREMAALSEDRSRLAQELDELKAQYRKLDEVNDEVSGRLDGAIKEIQGVLEN